MKRWEQTKPHALNDDQCEVQRSEVDDGDHDVLQSNVKFSSLKEQALFYSDISDDDPIVYHDVDVGKGSPEELADAIEGSIKSAEQAGMDWDGVQSLQQLVAECKDVFRLKLGTDPPANVKPLVIKLRDGAEPVRMSARRYASPQLKFMRDKIHEIEELGLAYKNTAADLASPSLILPKPGPDQYRMTVDLRVPNASTKPTAWPCVTFRMSFTTCMAQKYLRRWIFVKADTSAQRFSRLSIFHHAGWSVHTDTCTTWNDERYAEYAVCALRHDERHQEQHQSIVG
jgi:hypothetical protein